MNNRYRTLKNYWVEARPKAEIEPGPNGSILIPQPNTRPFLHWLSDSGKLIATHTLEYSTLIHSKVLVISKTASRVHVIDL